MEYPYFEYHVNSIVGNAHGDEYKHLLPGIHHLLRARFLHTLSLGYKIPDALYHINFSARLPEKNYHRYIKFVHSNASVSTYAGA